MSTIKRIIPKSGITPEIPPIPPPLVGFEPLYLRWLSAIVPRYWAQKLAMSCDRSIFVSRRKAEETSNQHLETLRKAERAKLLPAILFNLMG